MPASWGYVLLPFFFFVGIFFLGYLWGSAGLGTAYTTGVSPANLPPASPSTELSNYQISSWNPLGGIMRRDP